MKKKVNPILNTFLLFLVCFVVNGLITSYSKKIILYNDELLYYDIARNLWENGSIMVRQLPYFFQKTLYCYLIAPTFAIANATTRTVIIGWVNSFLMSLAVFPASGLIQRLIKDSRLRIFTSLFTVLMPCLAFCSSVMCEVLLYPLTILFFYLLVLMDENRTKKSFTARFIPAICAGVILYLLYWNKEICLYFVCGMIFYSLYHIIVAFIPCYKENATAPVVICQTFTVLLIFFLFYEICQITIFNDLQSSYAGVLNSRAIDLTRIVETTYFGLYNLNHFIMAFGVLPLLLPLVLVRNMSHKERGLSLFLYSSLFMCIGSISFLISSTEDSGSFCARLHLRYAEPMILLFWILFLHLYEGHMEEFAARTKAVIVLVLGYLAVFVAFAFRFDDARSFNTETALQGYSRLCDLISSKFTFLTQDVSALLLRLLLAVFWGFLIFFMVKKPTRFISSLCIGVITLTLFNNIISYTKFRNEYSFPHDQAVIYDNADEYLQKLSGNILFVLNQKETKDAYLYKYIDTYIDRDHYLVTIQELDDLIKYDSGNLNLNTHSVPTYIPYTTSYTELTSVDYLITYGAFSVRNTTEIYNWPLAELGYHLLIPNDSSVLSFEYDEYDLYTDPDNPIRWVWH